ncbi:hypothetical protein [Cellulomonas sp. HZM]|uniref:hypothetical protein n=1 Tax=Cellulomonas sp. HZM TaxID=1454010 RepID=UPI000493437A|nr:hypothetical protein [Cellulomonas sp. HZM]
MPNDPAAHARLALAHTADARRHLLVAGSVPWSGEIAVRYRVEVDELLRRLDTARDAVLAVLDALTPACTP